MIVSLKDSFKLIGISIVCFCAVFVCTFFLNYYMDILPLKESISNELMPLYLAQLATAKMTCAITGGFLSIIALIMLFFYIKLYIENHHQVIGIFKAMGYSNYSIAKSFIFFGISIFLGCSLGFAFGWSCMPFIYSNLTIEGLPNIKATFHFNLLIFLVIIPTIVFTFITFLYTFLTLHKPVLQVIKGKDLKIKKTKSSQNYKNRSFCKEMQISTLKSKKMLAFFVTFSCFCFSAMVQMGLSMENLVSGTMGIMILIIGVILAFISMLMAMTSLIKNNEKNIAVMKVMGFSKKDCFIFIFVSYIPLAIFGFILGTIYQFGLLSFMVNIIFKNVENMPSYNFDILMFFVTLLLFIITYTTIFLIYLRKANKVSIKKIMLES